MINPIQIRRACDDDVGGLADVTLDCVADGSSIGFMATLTNDQAKTFWKHCLDCADRHERVVLSAYDSKARLVVGTVQLLLSMADNQPHRADVAKLQVHRDYRGRGIATMLMQSIESEARAASRTLLVLDTVTNSDAFRLYQHLGWSQCGEIPNYALWPTGGPCNTTIFYKQISPSGDVGSAVGG